MHSSAFFAAGMGKERNLIIGVLCNSYSQKGRTTNRKGSGPPALERHHVPTDVSSVPIIFFGSPTRKDNGGCTRNIFRKLCHW